MANIIDKVTLENYIVSEIKPVEAKGKMEKVGENQSLFSKLFGCRHIRLSKPVTIGKLSYQYCSDCGARRKYDIENFKPLGAFYRPTVGENLHYT